MLMAKIISLLLIGVFFCGVSQTFGAEEQSKPGGAKKEGKSYCQAV
jgi:hypothetical protein